MPPSQPVILSACKHPLTTDKNTIMSSSPMTIKMLTFIETKERDSSAARVWPNVVTFVPGNRLHPDESGWALRDLGVS
jgi:hypothetical protein